MSATFSGLTAPRLGRIVRASALGLLQILRRPALPGVRELGSREQSHGLVTVADVDAKHIPDGQSSLRLLDNPDLVSGTHVPLINDSEVSAAPQRLREAAHDIVVVHPNLQPPAG